MRKPIQMRSDDASAGKPKFPGIADGLKEVIYNPPQIIELTAWQVRHLADLGISPNALMLHQVENKRWGLTAIDLVKLALGVGRQQGRHELRNELRELLHIKSDS